MYACTREELFMSKDVKGNRKHLTLDNRIVIEKSLDQRMSFKSIASNISKDPTTISKEIKSRSSIQLRSGFNRTTNKCSNRSKCNKRNLCTKLASCHDPCKQCHNNCNKLCSDFIKDDCPLLLHVPFVCNSCSKKTNCRLDKVYYRAATADSNYRTTLCSSRQGINMSPEELSTLDSIISPAILKGQSIAHIIATQKDIIPCTSRTIYNYIQNNVLSVRNLDLPRKVNYKPRKKSKNPPNNPIWKEGRRYSDFKEFITSYSDHYVVEMDTVIGLVSDKKVLLTLYFRYSHFMLILLLPEKTQACVAQALNNLEEGLGAFTFFNSFQTLLTDNGSEFKNPHLIELGISGLNRTNVYFCDPGASWQKPGIEKNHEYIRYILPKGSSFEDLTQQKVTLMTNHINSTARASLKGNTPFKLASLLPGKKVLDTLGMQLIDPTEVTLKPYLLK